MSMTRTTRLTALAGTALVGIALTLSACGGGDDASASPGGDGSSSSSGLDGTYYNEEGLLVIDGTSVAYRAIECVDGHAAFQDERDPGEANTANGELSEDGTMVVWPTDEEFIHRERLEGSSPITASSSGDIVQIDEYSFTAMDKDAAFDAYTEANC